MAKAKKVKAEETETVELPVQSDDNIIVTVSDSPDTSVSYKKDTPEETILEYASHRLEAEIRITHVLASLYPNPESLETSKLIKAILEKMNNEGKIEIIGNRHFDLGMTYYDEEAKAQKHNILNTEIYIKK